MDKWIMNDFKLIAYVRMALNAFADCLGEDLNTMPSIAIVLSDDTDYCGQMVVYGNDEMEYAHLNLDMDNINRLADIDNIDKEQALLETIYHEWIHYIHAIAHADSYALMMTHEGELWDSMITIGMDNGFIHRKGI